MATKGGLPVIELTPHPVHECESDILVAYYTGKAIIRERGIWGLGRAEFIANYDRTKKPIYDFREKVEWVTEDFPQKMYQACEPEEAETWLPGEQLSDTHGLSPRPVRTVLVQMAERQAQK